MFFHTEISYTITKYKGTTYMSFIHNIKLLHESMLLRAYFVH